MLPVRRTLAPPRAIPFNVSREFPGASLARALSLLHEDASGLLGFLRGTFFVQRLGRLLFFLLLLVHSLAHGGTPKWLPGGPRILYAKCGAKSFPSWPRPDWPPLPVPAGLFRTGCRHRHWHLDRRLGLIRGSAAQLFFRGNARRAVRSVPSSSRSGAARVAP